MGFDVRAAARVSAVLIAAVLCAGAPPAAAEPPPTSPPAAVVTIPDHDVRPSFDWPLRPRPRVVRAFEKPAQNWLPGHRGVDLAA
ncbi:MAG: hypothetical protein FWE39_08555, partial [Nocardiaceae bacterium]|nr:hypothetical protein [Nocardiaceae bacterium]